MFGIREGFDIVIGNPPYVRMEQIKDLKGWLEKHFECYTGRADLYVYFYERGLKLLRENGILTFISSNKYFRAAYGQKLRQFLTTQTRIHRIIDFGDAPVFTAIAYPTIVLLEKGRGQNATFAALNWEQGQSLEQFETVVQSQSFLMPQAELKPEGWQFTDHTALRLLEKLRKAGTPLGEYVNGRFYRGIVTGLNEAFVVDRATRGRLIAEHPSSAEVLKPFVRGRDVKRWFVDYQDLWLIFTRRGIDIEKYPAIKQHLEPFKGKLLKRATSHLHPWYELQQPQEGCWQEFERSKILYQEIATYQAFAWDDSGCYSNNKTFLIPDASLYLLALLNSKIVWFFLDNIVQKMAEGTFALQMIYMEQIPIPPASEQDRRAIEALVQKCISAKGQNVAHYEAEINTITARLYGLTDAERAIIEGMNTQ